MRLARDDLTGVDHEAPRYESRRTAEVESPGTFSAWVSGHEAFDDVLTATPRHLVRERAAVVGHRARELVERDLGLSAAVARRKVEMARQPRVDATR